MYSPLISVLKILAIIAPTTIAAYITAFACREMRRLLRAKLMKQWEVGFFSGWLIGGTISYFLISVICILFSQRNFLIWTIMEFSLPKILMLSFGASLFVTGPLGAAAAYIPWHRFGRRRTPKILGCGLHGSIRSGLVVLPNSRSNNREFVAIGCKTVLNLSREKWTDKLRTRQKIEPPPLTNTERKVINCRVNPDPMAIQLGTSCSLIWPADAD